MKILHIIPDLSVSSGGPVTALLGMSAAQARLGHRVTIAATDVGFKPIKQEKDIELCVFPSEFSKWRWSRELIRALPSLIQQADIVHLHTLWDHPVWIAADQCRKLNKPYIVRPCGMLDAWSLSQKPFKKKLYLLLNGNRILERADGVHFTSENELKNSKVRGLPEKSFVAPLGVSEFFYESFTGDLLSKKHPELKGKKILLFLSRLHYKKQPEVILDATKTLSDKYPDIFLIMAGDGDPSYLSELKKRVLKLGIHDKVLFTGLLDRASCRAAYAEASVFVLPSFQENFGLSIIEAAASGCALVVSNKVDLARSIENAGVGLTREPVADRFASAIDELLSDPDRRRRMGERGNQWVRSEWTWHRSVSRVDEVYRDILAGRRESASWESKED